MINLQVEGKTPSEKERLKNAANWVDISSLSSLKIFVGILFGPIDFRGSRDRIMFLISILSFGLMKKKFMLTGGRKSENLFLEYFMEDLLQFAILEK